MRYTFKTKKLKALLEDANCPHNYPPTVVDAFDEVMAIIDAATDSRVLFQLRGLNLEKLKGKRGRKGEWSMRLNRQWRLIVSFEEDEQGTYVLVHSISQHYK